MFTKRDPLSYTWQEHATAMKVGHDRLMRRREMVRVPLTHYAPDVGVWGVRFWTLRRFLVFSAMGNFGVAGEVPYGPIKTQFRLNRVEGSDGDPFFCFLFFFWKQNSLQRIKHKLSSGKPRVGRVTKRLQGG